jgi:hypothetical protein
MCKIAAARLGGNLNPTSPLVTSAWSLFETILTGVTEKKPGTAEFIALVAYLRSAGVTADTKIDLDDARTQAALRVITKTKTDLLAAGPLMLAAKSQAATGGETKNP